MTEVLIEGMTWVEAKEAVDSGKVVVVPVGSTELHGNHLPLSTDTVNVYALARLAAERCGLAIVTPPVSFGTVRNHMNFPGTTTIQLDTLKAASIDICSSLVKHGSRNIILLSGHRGNVSALGADSHSEWHADESATSVTLALHGELVHMDRAVKEHLKPLVAKFFRFAEDAVTNSVVSHGLPETDLLSDSGVIGDARLATWAKGEAVVAEAVATLCEVLAELASGE